MEEYRDGSFGEIKELSEKFKQLSQMSGGIIDKVEGLHIGSQEELIKIREDCKPDDHPQPGLTSEKTRLNDIEKKVNRILIHLGIDDKTEILKI